jgi:Protein of unknown function (DUF4231)
MATDTKAVEQAQAMDEKYVLDRYKSQIDYYWKTSSSNKKAYKRSRTWTITLGALVTLVSSLASATFIDSNDFLNTLFAVGTPLIAALLTIISGFSQSFHWGAAWRDMVVHASRLEKERDRFLATKAEEKNFQSELDLLNSMVIEETQSFFQRVLDSEVKPKEK